MDLSDYARNVLFCNGKMLGINKFLHKSTMYTDTNHNGLHTGTDISEITESGFVWFCKKAPQFYNVCVRCGPFYPLGTVGTVPMIYIFCKGYVIKQLEIEKNNNLLFDQKIENGKTEIQI